jgi:hypothetical protein
LDLAEPCGFEEDDGKSEESISAENLCGPDDAVLFESVCNGMGRKSSTNNLRSPQIMAFETFQETGIFRLRFLQIRRVSNIRQRSLYFTLLLGRILMQAD